VSKITSLETGIENGLDESKLDEISQALDELAKAEPALSEIVDLKFFCGFSFAEIAAMRDVSERTIQRQWEKARISRLFRSLRAANQPYTPRPPAFRRQLARRHGPYGILGNRQD
jgi:DNA-directed RNA polymerase specialized sigma24 family protein